MRASAWVGACAKTRARQRVPPHREGAYLAVPWPCVFVSATPLFEHPLRAPRPALGLEGHLPQRFPFPEPTHVLQSRLSFGPVDAMRRPGCPCCLLSPPFLSPRLTSPLPAAVVAAVRRRSLCCVAASTNAQQQPTTQHQQQHQPPSANANARSFPIRESISYCSTANVTFLLLVLFGFGDKRKKEEKEEKEEEGERRRGRREKRH